MLYVYKFLCVLLASDFVNLTPEFKTSFFKYIKSCRTDSESITEESQRCCNCDELFQQIQSCLECLEWQKWLECLECLEWPELKD